MLLNYISAGRVLALSVLASILAGCGTPEMGQSPDIAMVSQGAMPAPDEVMPGGQYHYALGPFDKIAIEVGGMPDQSREAMIDGQGMVSHPLAGSVEAAGLTTTELARVMERQLRNAFVRNPTVSVNLVEQQSKVLTIDGQVKAPGVYPVMRDMTLSQAVATAGGENEFATISAVMVFRESAGQQYVGLYDMSAIRLGNYGDPRVYPDDRIVVGTSQARRILDSFQGVTQLITTPLLVLLR